LLFIRIDSGFCAQVARIAVIESPDISYCDLFLQGFKKELKNSGINFLMDEYPSKAEGLIPKIKNGNYDLICPLGTQAAKIIISEFSDKPIVFSMLLDPWGSGVLNAGKSDRTNVTGVVFDIGLVRQFKFLKEVLPQIVNVGIIFGPRSAGIVEQSLHDINELGIKIIPLEVKSNTDVLRVLSENSSKQIDVFWSVPDWEIYNSNTLRYLLSYSFEKKIPLMSFSVPLVKIGALLGYVHDYPDLGRQTADLAVRIFKGEQPGNIPVVYPENIGYVVNLKSARYFKIDISKESLMKFQERFDGNTQS
jgi:ABC-type uncharacterized transport system substrate-binding protein